MDTLHLPERSVPVIAHRGLSGIETENTLAAFIAAGNRSYFGIETDVRVTGDGKFVLLHDDTTRRVCSRELSAEASDFDTLRSLTLNDMVRGVPRWDLRIPTPEEYILTCKRYGKTAVLELKHIFSPENIRRLLSLIRKLDYLEHTVFIAFDMENLLEIRRLLPEQPLQFLTETCCEETVQKLSACRIDLDIYYRNLDRTWVDRLHQNGLKVNCWTCDDPEEARRLIADGVDFITSNILE